MEQLLLDVHDTYVLTVADTIVRLACVVVFTGCVFFVASHRWFFLNWVVSYSTVVLSFNVEFVLRQKNLYGIIPETGSLLVMGLSIAMTSNGIRLFFSEERSIRSLVALGLFPAAAFLISGLITSDQNVMSAFGFLAASLGLLDPTINFYVVGFKKNRLYGSLLLTATQLLYSVLLAGCGIAMAAGAISVTTPEGIGRFLLVDLAGVVFIFISLVIIVMEQAQHQLRASAFQDPLTGLANRRKVYQFIENPRLSVEAKKFTSILLIDIDHFKSINDKYGHNGGDAILISFADRLRQVKLQPNDIAARWGGEEFILVLNGYKPADARKLAESCLRRLANEPYDVEGRPLVVTASIGLADQRSRKDRLNEVIERADKALYTAKAAGRNRLEVADYETELSGSLAVAS